MYFGFAAHLIAVEQTDAVALANGQKSAQTVVYIALGHGISLLVVVWAFYRISGGLFNLAVTLGMCLAGQLPWTRGKEQGHLSRAGGYWIGVVRRRVGG